MDSDVARPSIVAWRRGDPLDRLITCEWLVTNALGGYASGTIGGACTRRFHGQLIAALPAPAARTMMFNHIEETVSGPAGLCLRLSGDEHGDERGIAYPTPDLLEEFALENGLPVWRYSHGEWRIEKRLLMPHEQNTSYLIYQLIEGPPGLTLELRPSLHFRPHEGFVNEDEPQCWSVTRDGRDVEIGCGEQYPRLRIAMSAEDATFIDDVKSFPHVLYRIEKSRGYEYEGSLRSPGVIRLQLHPQEECAIVASTESWDVIRALSPKEAWEAEMMRRDRLLTIAGPEGHENFSAQLVLAADQFLINPRTRQGDEARVRASGDVPRTVIAGYHWFTDWGRDTMISLEGLTITTGRLREAGSILRTFATYIHEGLIPNLFPEGEHAGLYHTADATLWFFHAVNRYVKATNDLETLRMLVPKMVDIIDHHVRGTLFNIHVDPADGLLHQGAEGYQLTWMDAKVDGWVVTPRRGKAVEINALFYNALKILQRFCEDGGDHQNGQRMEELAARTRTSFNERFWYGEGGYLYDVVDAEGGGNDPSLRPNQIFSISLDYPVLDDSRWRPVFDCVRSKLVTPCGLRSLSPDDPKFQRCYDGDLRARDAAYHQGTVWGWLIGPFVDAWLRVCPDEVDGARALVDGFKPHLKEACIGTISEIFDAEPPYHPRGCAAQAWSVAEVLRCLHKLR